MKGKLSVVIPCFNEEKNISLLVEKFSKILPKDAELLLVDNGSEDNSLKILEELGKKFGFLRVVKINKNIGYGNGVLRGLQQARGDFLCYTHADLQADPLDVMRAFELADNTGARDIFVKGERVGRPIIGSFLSFWMGIFCSIILGKWLYEINAQPNLFHRSFLEKMTSAPNDFSFDLYCTYFAKKYDLKIVRFPVEFKRRIYGKSSWNMGLKSKIKFIKMTVDFTLRLKDFWGEIK